MLFYRTIDSSTLELLKKIQSKKLFKELRLVGGTSLALQIGHRISIDLDLFGILNNTDKLDIDKTLSDIGKLKTLHHTNNINIYTLNDVKVDIVNYHYPWLNKEIIIGDIKLASIKDIAAMKLSAISGRGSKKDFIDLFFILKQFSLKEIIEFYEIKYNDGSVFQVLRSLAYFDDADIEVMPKMFVEVSWKKIKKTIIEKLNEYIDIST